MPRTNRCSECGSRLGHLIVIAQYAANAIRPAQTFKKSEALVFRSEFLRPGYQALSDSRCLGHDGYGLDHRSVSGDNLPFRPSPDSELRNLLSWKKILNQAGQPPVTSRRQALTTKEDEAP